MTHIRIEYDRHEYFTREPNDKDSWDNGDTAADITVHGLYVVEDKNYRDLTVGFNVERDKTYYLLWADYNSGDSFGCYDNNFDGIDLFTTYEAAAAARKALLDDSEEYKYSANYVRDDGTEISYSRPWVGYFESLNSLNIQEVCLI